MPPSPTRAAATSNSLGTAPVPGVPPVGIGVIVPSDMALDKELWRWLPPDATLFLNRLPVTPISVTVEVVTLMGDEDLVALTVRELLPVAPDVVLYGCTSGSFIRGYDGERSLVGAMQTAGATVALTTSGAMLTAADHLGATRVSIATPYDSAITQRFTSYLEDAGITVVHGSHLGLHTGIWTVPSDVTASLIREADSPDAEAILVPCTNLPTYDVIAPVEAELGKPVITANQASLWAALRLAGRNSVGAGQALLADRLPQTTNAPSATRPG